MSFDIFKYCQELQSHFVNPCQITLTCEEPHIQVEISVQEDLGRVCYKYRFPVDDSCNSELLNFLFHKAIRILKGLIEPNKTQE